MQRSFIAALAAALVACSSQAAVISSINTPWPTSPDVQTLDANSLVNANRAINTTRIDRQSFRVPNDVTVKSIFLSASGYNNLAFNITFTTSSDTNSTSQLTNGTLVGSTITVQPFGSTGSGTRNLQIDLDPSEQFTLPGVTSPAGYVMAIQLVDTTSSTAAFNWVHANTGTDTYTLGRYRRDDGDTTNTRDFGLAINSGVPEPASMTLLAIGGLLTLRRRRD